MPVTDSSDPRPPPRTRTCVQCHKIGVTSSSVPVTWILGSYGLSALLVSGVSRRPVYPEITGAAIHQHNPPINRLLLQGLRCMEPPDIALEACQKIAYLREIPEIMCFRAYHTIHRYKGAATHPHTATQYIGVFDRTRPTRTGIFPEWNLYYRHSFTSVAMCQHFHTRNMLNTEYIVPSCS